MVSARVESNGTRALHFAVSIRRADASRRSSARSSRNSCDSLNYRGGRISTVAICHTDGCARGTGESLTIAWRCRGCHADSQFSTMRSGAFLTGRMIDRGLATLHRTIFDPVLSHARMTNGTNSSLRGGMIDPLVGEALMIALAMVMLDVLGD